MKIKHIKCWKSPMGFWVLFTADYDGSIFSRRIYGTFYDDVMPVIWDLLMPPAENAKLIEQAKKARRIEYRS